jgi:solute carrier family 29 (equilibrative nucleoside transporter), member 1/2/3
MSERFKLQYLFYFTGLIFFIVPFVTLALKSNGFAVVFPLMILFGIGNGFSQGAVMGAAGPLPSKYMGLVMTGNGVAAVSAGVMKIILLIAEINTNAQAYIQFTLGFAVFITSGFLYEAAKKSKLRAALPVETKKQSFAEFKAMLIENMHLTWKPLFSLSFTFIFTFLIFPGLIDAVRFKFWPDKWTDKQQKGWNDMTNALIFGVFDTVGRYTAGKVPTLKENTILMLTIDRLIFVFTTLSVVQNWFGTDSFMNSDVFWLLNMILFAFSNGFISTQCTIIAPQKVEASKQEAVGIYNSLFLGLGMLMGSILAMPMQNCVPNN